MKPCATCGGQCIDIWFDGAYCLQCGRPAVAPTTPAWVLEDAQRDVGRHHNQDNFFHVIVEREARTIAADRAAGRRVWA